MIILCWFTVNIELFYISPKQYFHYTTEFIVYFESLKNFTYNLFLYMVNACWGVNSPFLREPMLRVYMISV